VVLFLRSILIEVIITFINRSRLLIPDDMHLMSCKNINWQLIMFMYTCKLVIYENEILVKQVNTIDI